MASSWRACGRSDVDGRVRWFRYVRHKERACFEAQGWVFAADLGPVHGCWSVLMELTAGGDEGERDADLSL